MNTLSVLKSLSPALSKKQELNNDIVFPILNKCYRLVLLNGREIVLGTYTKNSVYGGTVTCINEAAMCPGFNTLLIRKTLHYPNKKRLEKIENVNISFISGILDDSGEFFSLHQEDDF